MQPTIEALHLRYDGPVPAAERDAALAGGAIHSALLQALAERRWARKLLVDQNKRVIKPRRRDGSLAAYQLADFRGYRRQFSRWHREVLRLQKAAS